VRAIDHVRAHLPKATDFAELYERFDDRVARAPELWDNSQPREHQVLFSIAVAISRQIRPGFEPKTCMLYEVGDTGFWHGAVLGSNALACLFYDQRGGLGLVALSNPIAGAGPTDFVRFAHGTLVPPSAAGSSLGRLLC
jgi:hypothetical protein